MNDFFLFVCFLAEITKTGVHKDCVQNYEQSKLTKARRRWSLAIITDESGEKLEPAKAVITILMTV